MPGLFSIARHLLQQHYGYPNFRPAQARVIRSILDGNDTLAILPTGGGKSICFQIPALALGGLTVVVSPLISLMQDQVEAARARGIAAGCLNSNLPKSEQESLRQEIAAGSLHLLYVSPERLDRLSLELQQQRIQPRLLVVDEAHCIAEWGSDFRPSYRKLGRARYRLGNPQAVALTGSATAEVRREIVAALRLKPGVAVHVGSFDRPNLWFGAVQVHTEGERLEALLELLRGDDAMAIVYAPTRGSTEAVARALCKAGHRAAPYHAGLTKTRRAQTLDDFLQDRVDVVVATCAFGMGIDKAAVRLVVHWTPPATPEAYYQEAGRAGRDGQFARCVMLWRQSDCDLHRRQLDVTFPHPRLLRRIWRHPGGTVGVPANVLESADRLRRELHPERGPVDWRPLKERRRRAAARIQAVEDYARQARCRRTHLVGYFGEELRRCAGCDRCGGRPATTQPSDPQVSARLTRLQRALAPRKTVWGGCPLEPEVLLRLARHPPADAAALADFVGVGPALTERLGGVILKALSPDSHHTPTPSGNGVVSALQEWRAGVACAMGVPPYVIVPDAVLRTIAEARPRSRLQLSQIRGVGPRTLAKFGDDLLRLTSAQASQESSMEQLDPIVPSG